MKKLIFLALFAFALPESNAQELFCQVNIDHSRIQSDKQVFQDMQQAISRYLNFNKWTDDEFEQYERIRCNIQIIINQRPNADQFLCTANIQVFRPTYNATYETPLVNLSDGSFNFNYVPFQELQFSLNNFTDNLTSLLDYYAYIILGIDYDSFSAYGGGPYFQKAQEVVNVAGSSAGEKGWRSGESQRNRFWLVENLLNNNYKSFRNLFYRYHRQGLDQMEKNLPRARTSILDSVRDLKDLNNQFPLIRLPRIFIDAKKDELIGIFSNAFVNDKQQFVEIMGELDPANLSKYEKVLKD